MSDKFQNLLAKNLTMGFSSGAKVTSYPKYA